MVKILSRFAHEFSTTTTYFGNYNPAGSILQQAGVHHMVEPPHLRLERDDTPVSRRGFGLTKPADILLHA